MRYIRIFKRNINNEAIAVMFNFETGHSYFRSYFENTVKMLKQGKEWREIHKEEQRAWDKTQKGLESHNEARNKWESKNRYKLQQRKKLNYIFQNGNISNDEFECAICGKIDNETHICTECTSFIYDNIKELKPHIKRLKKFKKL